MQRCAARYREFLPCPALRRHVRWLFTFTTPAAEFDEPGPALLRETRFGSGEPYSGPLFADGHSSVVFVFGPGYRIEGLWEPGSGASGHWIGPMTAPRAARMGETVVQIGAYLRASSVRTFTRVSGKELADRVVSLDDLWGAQAAEWEQRLAGARNDRERIAILEVALLSRRRDATHAFDAGGLTEWIVRERGATRVEEMARHTGLSRQHFARLFRESVGLPPKLYARLVRFRGALSAAGRDWAGIAADLGYTDQSHLIAEVKQFTGLTPAALRPERSFHPFLGSGTV